MKRFFLVLLLLTFATTAHALPSYSELYGLFIDLKGWQAEKPTGSNMSSPMGQMVTAERTYKKGSKEIHAQIVGGTAAMVYLTPFQTGITYDSPEEMFKTLKIEGLPAGVSYEKQEHAGLVVVQLTGDKNTVPAVFVINYSNMSYEEAIEIVKRFPLKKMQSIFK